jgi:hypothetical protein
LIVLKWWLKELSLQGFNSIAQLVQLLQAGGILFPCGIVVDGEQACVIASL